MKKTFRAEQAKEYWENRWGSAGVDMQHFENLGIYPVKYADAVVAPAASVLEAGCGTGRLYFHYRRLYGNEKTIHAFDYSENAVNNILRAQPDADVIQADVTCLPYADGAYDAVLAFGLFHGIEAPSDIVKGLAECARVLAAGGRLLFSVRLNGLENDIIDYRTKRADAQKHGPRPFDQFHKWQFDVDDMDALCRRAHLQVEHVELVRNVSFLFKWNAFRHRTMKKKVFKESVARSTGFRLNFIGRCVDGFLHRRYPQHFSNLILI
ncbi:MAG: class I SAM-dependent methyltransferase, partial [Oscillospiraceae bacterium]